MGDRRNRRSPLVALLCVAIGLVGSGGCGDDGGDETRFGAADDDADDDDVIPAPTGDLDIAGVRFLVRPDGMKLIPEGLGGYGCDPDFDDGCKGSDAPIGVVSLGMYWIDERETSVEKYDACANAGACRATTELPGPVSTNGKDPITFVTAEDAKDFCAFVGGRLPSDAEWERAARGVEGLRYPWGEAWCDTCCNWCDNAACDGSVDGYDALAPVTEFPNGASPYGVFQLSGNVWEWTVGPDAEGVTRTWLRGGGYGLMDGVGDDSRPEDQYRATRRIAAPNEPVGGPMFGFRCAADPVYE